MCRAPAQQGDIARAVMDGASAIGLVDGRYEDVAAPWHKEILYALSRGIAVYGAASMGALRAAECAAYGMVPVGSIAQRYLSGEITDDAAVAQIHASPEMGCRPLTEALINVQATIENARTHDAISQHEAEALLSAAKRMFFKERTYRAIVEAAGFSGDQAAIVLEQMRKYRRDVKRDDALQLVDAINVQRPNVARTDWTFRETATWRSFISTVKRKDRSDEQ